MTMLHTINEPQEIDLLVAFFDLSGFARYARKRTNREVLDALSAYYELVGEHVESSGGTVVKFMGDAGLIVYPGELVDQGVLALKAAKAAGDAWWVRQDASSQAIYKLHFGPVYCAQIGTRTNKQFDIFGNTVNTTALLTSSGFAMTAQVFRRLSPETRKLFKKHTPPITYIPLEESHRD